MKINEDLFSTQVGTGNTNKTIKLKDNYYGDSTGIVHSNQRLDDVLRHKQEVILSNRNAGPGTINKVTIPINYYAGYLVISTTPYGDFNAYVICVISGSSIKAYKISGTQDSTFSINGKELTIQYGSSGYGATFVELLGNIG